MFTTLVSVFMLMADGTGGDQLTTEIGSHSGLCLSLNTDNDLHATLVEDVHCSAAHASGDAVEHRSCREPPLRYDLSNLCTDDRPSAAVPQNERNTADTASRKFRRTQGCGKGAP